MPKKRRGRGDGEIEELPNGKYRARICRTLNKKRVRQSKTFTKRAEAAEWIRKNTDSGPSVAGTLGDWLTQWVKLHGAEVAASTAKLDRLIVERLIRPGLGEQRLSALTPPLSLRHWLAELKEKEVSQGERHNAGKVLRTALNAAVRAGQLSRSPLQGVKIPVKPTAKPRAFSAEQARAVLKTADEMGHGAMFRLWLDTGMRPGELYGLSWSNVDLETSEVRILESLCAVSRKLKEPKTARGKRVIVISAGTVEALKKHRDLNKRSGIVFPAPEGGYWWEVNAHNRIFKPLGKRVGFKVSPYRLRHTMATLAFAAGVNLKIVSARLGHSNEAFTLATYVHAMPGDQAIAARAIGAILDGTSPIPTVSP